MGFAVAPPIGGFLYSVECLETCGIMLMADFHHHDLLYFYIGWWVQTAVHHRGCVGTAVCNTDVLPPWKDEYVLHPRLLVMG